MGHELGHALTDPKAPPPAPEPGAPPPPPPVPAGWATIAACIRHHESGGDYSAVSATGKYRGAYQMDDAFWLAYGGTPSLAGRHEQAPPAKQDAVAHRGWLARGLAPWPTPNAVC